MGATVRQNGKLTQQQALSTVMEALVRDDGDHLLETMDIGNSHVIRTKNIPGMRSFKLVNGENGLCFSVDCDHTGDDPWCGDMALMFQMGLERLLLAARVGTNFNLTVPIYPDLGVGMTLNMKWDSSNSFWVSTLPLEGESGSNRYDVGTFSVLARRAHMVAAVEDLFFHVADVNPDLKQKCERCAKTLANEKTAKGLVIMGMTGLCIEHYCKAKSFEDVAPDATSNATSVPTMREMTSVDDVPLGTGMMTGGPSAHHTYTVDETSISGSGMQITDNDRHVRERLDMIFKGDQYRGS